MNESKIIFDLIFFSRVRLRPVPLRVARQPSRRIHSSRPIRRPSPRVLPPSAAAASASPHGALASTDPGSSLASPLSSLAHSLPLQPPPAANGWASPPGDLFHLRARGYFSGGGGKRGKAPSAAEWLLRPVGVDWLRFHARLDHVLARDDNRVAAAFRRARLRKDPTAHFLLAVNLQVPGRPDAYSAVFYFAAEAPIPPDSLIGRFVRGDDAYRNARFKIANRIVKGPWLVRATVGNYALTCRYHKGDDYLEIDVDIGSSAIASAILHLAARARRFLVESQSEEELPERLFGAVRIAQAEMSAAKYVELPPDEAMPETAGRAGAGFRVSSAKVVNHSRQQEHAGGKVGRSMSCPERDSGGIYGSSHLKIAGISWWIHLINANLVCTGS